jgi:hypothetical protein
MKKFFIAISMMALFLASAKAQNTFPSAGNVGIGTTSPKAALDVAGFIQISGINRGGGPPADIDYGLFPYGEVGLGIFSGAIQSNQGIGIWTNPDGVKKEVMRILSGGNVGVGTITPISPLQVSNGSSKACIGDASGQSLVYGTSYFGLNAGRTGTTWSLQHDGANNGGSVMYGNIFGDLYFATVPSTGSFDKVLSDSEIRNKVNFRISSNGITYAKTVQVETTGWPDYVFKSDYSLPSLTELKQYIDTHQHLPDFRPAKEIEKEGINVGEMSKTLTKKVEELTLYLIEKDIELKEQKKLNADLQTQVNGLAQQMEMIKKKLKLD